MPDFQHKACFLRADCSFIAVAALLFTLLSSIQPGLDDFWLQVGYLSYHDSLPFLLRASAHKVW